LISDVPAGPLLSAFSVSDWLPPLRERPEDIHPLVIHFLEHYKQKTGRFISGISKDALQALITYDWPGNVRELENAIERAVIIASGRQIELEDLPEAISKIAFRNAIGSRWNAQKLPAKDARPLLSHGARRQWKRSSARPSKPRSTTPRATNLTPPAPSASAARRSTASSNNTTAVEPTLTKLAVGVALVISSTLGFKQGAARPPKLGHANAFLARASYLL
jgi:DNA-binding NtrC family response regulator